MPGFRDLLRALQGLHIPRTQPVLVHASLSAFGQVSGGAEAVVRALLGSFDTVLAPTFTFKTMLIPESGPENNACAYGGGRDHNRLAEFFTPDMPADSLMGVIPETLRRQPRAARSTHPILSFAGLNAAPLLEAQSLKEPLGPVRLLYDYQGWVILMGVDHTVNTSLHYAERLAGRKQFVRWALTPDGVQTCAGFPGCSDGFQALQPHVEGAARRVEVNGACILALPVATLVDAAVNLIRRERYALLCSRPDCQRCSAVRESI